LTIVIKADAERSLVLSTEHFLSYLQLSQFIKIPISSEVPDPPIDVITEAVTSHTIRLLIFPSLNYNGELALGIDVAVTILVRTPFRWADHNEGKIVYII
jgi:hypothetical protein